MSVPSKQIQSKRDPIDTEDEDEKKDTAPESLDYLLNYIYEVNMNYDKAAAKLYYRIYVKDPKFMYKFVERFNLRPSNPLKQYWSYAKINQHTDLTFIVSYEWLLVNFPKLFDLIEINRDHLELICAYFKKIAEQIYLSDDKKHIHLKFANNLTLEEERFAFGYLSQVLNNAKFTANIIEMNILEYDKFIKYAETYE